MHSSFQCYYWHDNIFFVQIGGPKRQSIWSSCGRVPPPTPRLHILKTVYMVVKCLSSISKWIVKLFAFVNLAQLWLGQRPSEGVKLEEAGVTSISLAWVTADTLLFQLHWTVIQNPASALGLWHPVVRSEGPGLQLRDFCVNLCTL